MKRPHRVIEGLRWSARRAEGPWGSKVSRARGAKALGLRYEKSFGQELPSAIRGQWWEFEDSRGGGWCQTDFLLEGRDSVLVLEAKYTWVPQGHSQILQLYKPVVEKALGKPVLGIVVCKALRAGMPPGIVVSSDLRTALAVARSGRASVLQWIGTGPLLIAPATQALAPLRAVA